MIMIMMKRRSITQTHTIFCWLHGVLGGYLTELYSTKLVALHDHTNTQGSVYQ